MNQFEIGKTYSDGEGIEIKVLKRTDKTITFIYTGKNWYEQDTEKEYRKKIQKYHKEYEAIELGTHWSAPSIMAA